MGNESSCWGYGFIYLVGKMTAVELDPLFVRALKLLQSKSKDAADQLKQMHDDIISQRKLGVQEKKVTLAKT